jgi:hypothetical protein
MRFLKKQEAINYYTNKIKNKTKISYGLFQEDVDRAGSKCFYVEDIKNIYKKIISSAEPHFYEFWTENTPIVFGMDIDFDISKNKISPDELLTKIINIVIDSAKEYYSHNYNISDIIILENDSNQQFDNPNKYSAHIIFRGLKFENYLVAKDFYQRMNKEHDLQSLNVDKSIYNMTCLRLFMNTKMNKTAMLVPKRLKVNDEYTTICNIHSTKEEMYNFFLSTMITVVGTTDKIIHIKDIKHKSITNQIKYNNNNNSTNISNINLEYILMNLPPNYSDEYDYWIKIGMILFQYEMENNYMFNLWDKFSQQSSKYKSDEIISKWNSFKNLTSKITIGSLIKWAKDENIANIFLNPKLDINHIVNSYPVKPIEINTDDIPQSNITILSQAKLTPDVYVPVLNKKLIAVQSEKGTGKTSNLLETLFKNENTRINSNMSILFISSRITFGYKLLGDLEEYGFELYSNIKEQQIYSNRIICQIDSLMRLEKDKYDIIIIDECETLARYITSNHFTKNNKANLIVSMLEMRVNDANQLYIMDADLSDRCINFYKKAINLKSINDFHLIINSFKPYTEYQLTYCHYSTWLRKILTLIESNKKLVIAMASNAKAKDLNKKIIETFREKKVLFIHRETSDEDKKSMLLNVNEEWIKYDIIIYTPSVCMGVSFDITNHFDNIFAYGCHESLGAQEWCQMIHRVRSPINKEIFVSIDNYKLFDKEDNTVNYQMVEKMLCSDYYLTNYDLHTNIVSKKIKKYDESDESNMNTSIGSVSIDEKILYYPYKSEPIYDLYVRNSWEMIENKLNFAASFFGYAKFKEYKLHFLESNAEDNSILADMKEIREERTQLETDEKINGILNAKDLTTEEFNIKIKQRDEYITKDDMYAIYRYNLRKCYNIIDEINKEFIEEYHDKELMKWYRNISTIISTNTQSTNDKLCILKDNQQYDSIISNCYNDFTTRNKYSYHYYPIEIIKIFGFDINNLTICIPYAELISKTYDAIAWCSDKKDDIAFKYNLNIQSKDLIDLTEVEQLKYINKIIESQYGLKIKRMNTSATKDNIMYKLDDIDRWNNLNDKIKPIEIKTKRYNRSNVLDTSNLDVFIDE